MRPTEFIHVATIKRVGQSIVGQRKQTSIATIATNVACRFVPLRDNEAASVMGVDVLQTWRGYWPPGTDIVENDEVVWGARILNVISSLQHYGRENDVSHVETVVREKRKAA